MDDELEQNGENGADFVAKTDAHRSVYGSDIHGEKCQKMGAVIY